MLEIDNNEVTIYVHRDKDASHAAYRQMYYSYTKPVMNSQGHFELDKIGVDSGDRFCHVTMGLRRLLPENFLGTITPGSVRKLTISFDF